MVRPARPLNADDLDPETRKRLGLGSRTANREPRTTRQELGGGVHLRCHSCGKEFTKTTGPNGYEAHSDLTRHRRFDVVDPGNTDQVV